MDRLSHLPFLGVGNAFSYELGNNSATFARGNVRFFIDMGGLAFQKALEHGLFEGIDHIVVFLTHLHNDHIGSMAELLPYFTFKDKTKTIDIVYPDKEAFAKVMLPLVDPSIAAYHEERNGTLYGISYSLVEAKHVPGSYSYYLSDEEEAIFYSGDSCLLNLEAFEKLEKGELACYYVDLDLATSPMHLGLPELLERVDKDLLGKFVAMHSPSKEFRSLALEKGLRIAELIQ